MKQNQRVVVINNLNSVKKKKKKKKKKLEVTINNRIGWWNI